MVSAGSRKQVQLLQIGAVSSITMGNHGGQLFAHSHGAGGSMVDSCLHILSVSRLRPPRQALSFPSDLNLGLRPGLEQRFGWLCHFPLDRKLRSLTWQCPSPQHTFTQDLTCSWLPLLPTVVISDIIEPLHKSSHSGSDFVHKTCKRSQQS